MFAVYAARLAGRGPGIGDRLLRRSARTEDDGGLVEVVVNEGHQAALRERAGEGCEEVLRHADQARTLLLGTILRLILGWAVIYQFGHPLGFSRVLARCSTLLQDAAEVGLEGVLGGPLVPQPQALCPEHAEQVREEVPHHNLLGVLLLHLNEGIDYDRQEEIEEGQPDQEHEGASIEPIHQHHREIQLLDTVRLNELADKHHHLRLDGFGVCPKRWDLLAEHPMRHESHHEEQGAEEHQKVDDAARGLANCIGNQGHLWMCVEVEHQLKELNIADSIGNNAMLR
mmetsp:Transcript_31036/g.99086  ORF Transcript_31036/g.99086 Transcript_31036/m.99086 type:complete len:285 (+) Transcript_31036:273-1127(+)